MLVSENYIEAIAHKLNLDIDHVREINLYQEGQKTPYHQKVIDYHVPTMLQRIKVDVDYERRKKEIEQFNRENRWRKKGLALVPTKFGLAFGVKSMNQGSALVHIYLDGESDLLHPLQSVRCPDQSFENRQYSSRSRWYRVRSMRLSFRAV